MYKCDLCGSWFSEPDKKTVCLENYYGVGGEFRNKHYGDIDVCPCCGHDEFSSYAEEEDDYDE